MANIEKKQIIDSNNLNSESYFASILQEAYACGLINDNQIENIQLQCINFLAYKCEKYNGGDSSSIRVEAAEVIMKSNLYTIGLFLKSLPNVNCAVSELKTAIITEMYQKGRKLINAKLHASKHIYKLTQKNRLTTLNYTYNATLMDNGIGSFFKLYDPDYEAHGSTASIDYQLCNPVIGLAGVEFIQKYLENLYLENEFCRNFASENIHHLLCGYDEGYRDLLINIFEQVLTAALGCLLVGRRAENLDISEEEIQCLYNELLQDDDNAIVSKIHGAAGKMLQELNVTNPSLIKYIEKSLPKITSNIKYAVKTDTLQKTLVHPVNPDLKTRIEFSSGIKMDDEDYRKLIDELLICRYLSDKLALIKEKVKSFGDFEDVLFDGQLKEEEINSVLGILGDVEIAALIKRYPFKSDIDTVDLSEAEKALRLYLKSYVAQLEEERREQICKIMENLIDD